MGVGLDSAGELPSECMLVGEHPQRSEITRHQDGAADWRVKHTWLGQGRMEADEDKLRTSPCPTEYGLGKNLRRPLMGTKNFLIWTAVATIPQFVYR